MKRQTSVPTAACVALSISCCASAQEYELDRYFGYFAPPEIVPVDIATDAAGNAYVLDLYHEVVHVVDADGDRIDELPVNDALQSIGATLVWPRGITVDSADNIYIMDVAGPSDVNPNDSRRRIYKFDAAGSLLAYWPVTGQGMSIDAQDRIATIGLIDELVRVYDTNGNVTDEFGSEFLHAPTDVAIGPSGEYYVADPGRHRIVKFHPDGTFAAIWGSLGEGPEQFNSPVAVATDSSGNVFITDRRNSRIKKYTQDGVLVGFVGEEGPGPGEFLEPHGLVVDVFDRVWVANYHGHNYLEGLNVQVFDNDLNFLFSVPAENSGPGEHAAPIGVAVDSNGNVLIADKWNQRVTSFDSAANYRFAWGKRGQHAGPVFNFPRIVAVDADDNVFVSDDRFIRKFDSEGNFLYRWDHKVAFTRGIVVDDNDYLYATEPSLGRIVKIDQATDEVTYIGAPGTGPGEFDDPWGLAIGPDGRLYVADGDNARVQRLTLDGQFELEWGTLGDGPGQFRRPSGLAIDDSGHVYVGDARSGRVQIFDRDGVYLDEFGQRGWGRGRFQQIWSLAVDSTQRVYVVDTKTNNRAVTRFSKELTEEHASASIIGEPSYRKGGEAALYAWKETFDGPYRFRVNGGGYRSEFVLDILSERPIESVVPFSLETDDHLVIDEASVTLVGALSTHEDGLEVDLPSDARALVGFEQNATSAPHRILFGKTKSQSAVAGWTRRASDYPPRPPFEVGVDEGVFIGQGVLGDTLEVRISSDGELREDRMTILSGDVLPDVIPLRLEPNDRLVQNDHVVQLDTRMDVGWDGIDLPTSPDALIGVAHEHRGAFRTHWSNFESNPMPLPNAVWLPRAEPYGKPPLKPGEKGGVFVWKQAEHWTLAVLGPGAGATQRYRGTFWSNLPLTEVEGVKLEPHDGFDVSDPARIEFDLVVGGAAQDQIRFRAGKGARLFLDLSTPRHDAANAVYVGQRQWPVEALPLDLSGW